MQKFSYSPAGLAMTKRCEGVRLQAYQDGVGVWTIGVGHTGPLVHSGLVWTEAQVDAALVLDIAKAVDCVNAAVTAEITQGQFDALVDFAFNLGNHALEGSTLLNLVNAGKFAEAAGQFALWVHAGGKVEPGLVERRKAEVAMFKGDP